MTLIECFSNAHIDNIAACLRLNPDTMIMVGDAAEMAGPVERYQRLLKQRNFHTRVSLCDVREKDFSEICAVMKRLVLEAGDCVIDMTGGDATVIMAVGAVLASLTPAEREQIRIEKFDRDANTVRDCIHDHRKIRTEDVSLTVAELIMLHGGKLYPDSYQPPADSNCRELAGLWEIVSQAPKDWNREIMLLAEFESRSEDKMQIVLPLEELSGNISEYEQKEDTVRNLLDRLRRHGVIDDRSSRDVLKYTYQSYLLRYCAQKAGNVLEVKTLLEGRAVLENGAPYFQDCRMSVNIDWDGVTHMPVKRIPETRNEIDVVLMHGTTPLFISCKNGNIGEEELYKLNTVAERFGGPYARKMLIATELNQKNSAANRAFIQRAWDMDIFLVTDAAQLDQDEWGQIFKNVMQ